MKLSKIQEGDGDITKAADTLLELQVETFGSMDRVEKVASPNLSPLQRLS